MDSEDRPEWLDSKFESTEAQAKAYNEVKGLIGRKGVMPAPDAPPEEWSEAMSKLVGSAPEDFRNAHTVPKEAKDYGLKAPEGMEEAAKQFSEEMAELGVPKGIASRAWEKQLEAARKLGEENAKAIEAKKTALEDAFGSALERVKTEANAALDAYGDDALREFLTEHGENPVMLGFLAKVGKTLGEDRINYTAAHSGKLTPAELEEQIAELRTQDLEWSTKAFRGNLTELESKQAAQVKAKLMKLLEQRPGGSDPANVVMSVSSR